MVSRRRLTNTSPGRSTVQTNFVTSGSLRERIPDHEGPSWVERQQGTVEGARLYEQERLVLAATEDLCELMVRQDVSKAELARRLGTSRANITQLRRVPLARAG